jgi:hypothetical protein
VTQLCAIPTCRIRGRHLPDCDTDGCAGCLPRVAEAGNCCDVCVSRTAAALTAIITLTPDARSIAYGEVRRSSGGGSNKPGSRSPGNDDAMDALGDVHDRLARASIHIAVTRGMRFHVSCLPSCIKPTPSQAHCATCHETFGSVRGFDRHRRGGQCLDPATMPGIHRNPAGVWRFDGGENRAAARSGTPQTAETVSGVVPVGVDDSETAETRTAQICMCSDHVEMHTHPDGGLGVPL